MSKIPAHILPLARAAAAKVWRDVDGHNEARRIEEGENDGFAVKVAAMAIQMEQERNGSHAMTTVPDEIKEIAEEIADNCGGYVNQSGVDYIAGKLQAAIQAERERCAMKAIRGAK